MSKSIGYGAHEEHVSYVITFTFIVKKKSISLDSKYPEQVMTSVSCA